MKKNKKPIEFYSTQSLDNDDKELVLEVLNSDYLTTGPKIEKLENLIGSYCKNAFALAVNSGTSALTLAYEVCEVGIRSLVWTTPLTFVATAACAVRLGASIDFVDIDPETLNICPILLEKKLETAKKHSILPDVVTVVHFAGSPVDMEHIANLAKKYKFKIIEDASHALGSIFKDQVIGQNKFSDVTVFSFHPVKIITTGEGGAVLVSDKEDFLKARSLRSHGINRDSLDSREKPPAWFYEQNMLGYNFRMSELHAGLGVSQIKKLDAFIEKRNTLAAKYKEMLEKMPLKFQKILPGCRSSYHLFTIEILNQKISRDDLYNFLQNRKIGCQVHYIPVHTLDFFKKLGFSSGMFKNSERYFERCLSIPLHPNLEIIDLENIKETLNEFFSCYN